MVWISEPRWAADHWRAYLAVAASAPPAGPALIEEIVGHALRTFPGMRIEKPLG